MKTVGFHRRHTADPYAKADPRERLIKWNTILLKIKYRVG